MKNTGLLSRLGRKALPLLAGAMSSIYACDGKPTAPIPPPPINQKPVASFAVQPREGYAPLMVSLDGSLSKDPDGNISKYIWTFGDGSADSTSGVSVQHPYPNGGNYFPSLTVVDNKGARSTKSLDKVLVKDATPSINVPDFSFNEDEQYNLDLNGKIVSPIYGNSGLRVTATSPNLEVVLNGSVATVTNKTKDWNGSTSIDFTVEDQDGRKTTKRTNVTESPMTDIKGYFEKVLEGTRIPGVPISYGGVSRGNSDSNWNFDFQVPISSDTLKVNSSQFYNVKLPINANGQDVNLNNLQMIERYIDPITKEDLLEFMNKYMQPSRWDDSDLPIPVLIHNNSPSPEYEEAVRRGIMSWDTAVNQWLPEGRKLVLAQIVNTDPATGIRVDYNALNQDPEFGFINPESIFKKGVIKMNPAQVGFQLGDAISRTSAHEFGHGLGVNHTPYLNQNMYGSRVLPSPFEGLVVATKYKLKKDAVGFYSK
jgi:PKD repeat protein